MLHLIGGRSQLCDGLTRRELLSIGGLALGGLTLPALCAGRARATPSARRPRRCLQLFMWGGPAQQETFDVKTEAPDGVAPRGRFGRLLSRAQQGGNFL